MSITCKEAIPTQCNMERTRRQRIGGLYSHSSAMAAPLILRYDLSIAYYNTFTIS